MPSFPTEVFTDNQSVFDPSETENPKKVLEFVKSCLQDSDVYRNKFSVLSESMSWMEDANKFDDLYNGHLYSKRRKLPYECKEDIYAEAVDFNATLLTQFDIKDYVKQVTEEDQSLDADIMTRILNYCLLELNDGKAKEEDMLRLGGILGNGNYEFEPFEGEDGYIWPGHQVIDLRQMFISPKATGPKDAVYMGKKVPVSVYELRQKFPKFKDAIQPDQDISDFDGKANTNDGSVQVNGLGTAARLGMDKLISFFSAKEASQQCWLTKMYYRDPERLTLSTPEEVTKWVSSNPGFGSAFFMNKVLQKYLMKLKDGPFQVKKYQFGRKIVCTKDVVLSDVPSPYPFFPFPTFKCYRRPKAYWSKGVIEKIREGAQNEQMISAGLAANIDYRNRASYYCKTNLPINVKKVPTEPNELMAAPGDIQAIPVPPVATQDVMGLIAYRANRREQVSGLPGILGGANPTGNYSGIQTNTLMEAALGKVAPRFRDFSRCKKELGEMYLWFLQNYCTDERMLQFMSSDEQQLKIQLNQLQMVNGQPMVTNDMTKGQYCYMVDENTNQPATPSQKFQMVQAAAKVIAPFSPIEAAKWQLNALPFPDRFNYIQDFEKSMQDQQNIQMRQQMMEMNLKQQQMEADRAQQERLLDTKEVLAGAKAQESLAWVIQALMKATTDAATAGIAIPPQLMAELNTLAQKTAMETSQAGNLGNPNLPVPSMQPVGLSQIPNTPMSAIPGGQGG